MSYIRNRIAGAIRSRLAADLTGARDLTASPFPVSAGASRPMRSSCNRSRPRSPAWARATSSSRIGRASSSGPLAIRGRMRSSGPSPTNSPRSSPARPSTSAAWSMRMVPAVAEVQAARGRKAGLGAPILDRPSLSRNARPRSRRVGGWVGLGAPDHVGLGPGADDDRLGRNLRRRRAGDAPATRPDERPDRPALARVLCRRIISTGVIDQELETGIASGSRRRYRAAVLTGISGTGKNQTTATVHGRPSSAWRGSLAAPSRRTATRSRSRTGSASAPTASP